MAINKTAPVILVAAVVAAIAVGTWLARKSGATDAVEPVPAPDGTASVSTVQPPPSTTPVAQSPAQVRERMQQSTERRKLMRQEQMRKTAELSRQAAETFRTEQVDPAWAPQKEDELGDIAAIPAFETAGAVPRSMEIECKSSMCRVNGSFATTSQAEDWILLYMSSVGSAMPNALVSRSANPDGSTSVEIYGRGR